MSLIILNGSPKGDRQSATDIFIRQFVKDMNQPYEIKLIAGAAPAELCEVIKKFDTIIVAMPLYIHAMPGIVLKLFEQLPPAERAGKSIGFMVQAGFVETEQQKYLLRYFKQLAARLRYNYLGTVQKGDTASLPSLPGFMNQKLYSLLNQLGKKFEETGAFDQSVMEHLRNPYRLSKSQACAYQFAYKIGINSLPWSMMQRKNHAFRQRFARPFLE